MKYNLTSMFKLPSIFKPKSSRQGFLTIDIGSEQIKVVAFDEPSIEHKNINILASAKARVDFGSIRNGYIIDEDAVAEALIRALAEVHENLEDEIDRVIFGVGGEQVYAQMTTIKAVRGKSEPVTQKEITEFEDRVNEAALSEIQNLVLSLTGRSDLDLELVTKSTIYTKLDGKRVDSLLNQEGQELEIAIFNAYSPAFHLASIARIADKIGVEIQGVGSSMYAVVKSMEVLAGDSLDCVVIDVGSQSTEVGAVFGGGIFSIRSLPIGGFHFTNELSNDTGLTFFDAERKKIDYSFGNLNDEEALEVEESISDVGAIWLSGVEESFKSFDGVKTFASKILLLGGGAQLPEIMNMLQNEPWAKSIPFKEPPQIDRIHLKDFKYFVDKTGGMTDPELLIAALLAVIYLENTEGFVW